MLIVKALKIRTYFILLSYLAVFESVVRGNFSILKVLSAFSICIEFSV